MKKPVSIVAMGTGRVVRGLFFGKGQTPTF